MKQPEEIKRPTSYSIDDETKKRLDQLAVSEQRSRSQLVRIAVARYHESVTHTKET